MARYKQNVKSVIDVVFVDESRAEPENGGAHKMMSALLTEAVYLDQPREFVCKFSTEMCEKHTTRICPYKKRGRSRSRLRLFEAVQSLKVGWCCVDERRNKHR